MRRNPIECVKIISTEKSDKMTRSAATGFAMHRRRYIANVTLTQAEARLGAETINLETAN